MIKTIYKYIKDKNRIWNQYTLLGLSRFSHSVKTCANKWTLLVQSGLEPATFRLQAERVPDWTRWTDV